MKPRLRSPALSACLTLACLAGCAGTPVTKQGVPRGSSSAPVVLHLASADREDPEQAFFVDAVAGRSQHRLRFAVDTERYSSADPRNEARLPGDLLSGQADFAFMPARDWAAAGLPAFQAIQAPFLVTTTAAAVDLTTSPIAAQVLDDLRSSGLVGLSLIPGQARRLLSTQPLLDAHDLEHLRVKINDNPQTAALMTALGAVPVQGLKALEAKTELQSGGVGAVESSPTYIANNSYNAQAPFLTSYGLFPKMEIIVATGTAWDRLSEEDQKAIRSAAADTLTHAITNVPRVESDELSLLCTNGVVIVRPAQDQLDALAALAGPAAPASAAARTLMQRIASTLPGSGPQIDATPPPSTCRVATTGAQAKALRDGPVAQTPAQPGTGTIPPGVYQTTITVADFRAAGATGVDFSADVTFTYEFKADGTWHETQKPDYPDQGPLSGRYTITGDRVTFTFDPSPTGAPSPETVSWSYFNGQLTFKLVSAQDPGARILYETHPWRKIG